MSALIYLVALGAVAWLVLWTIRDPKEPKWEWWPIEWWPFDTESEAAVAAAAEAEDPPSGGRQAVPWRERRRMTQRKRRTARTAPRTDRRNGGR